MMHDEIRDALGAFALDALAPEESADIVAHLESCAGCRMEYERLAAVHEQLGLLAEELEPPPALRARLLAIVEQERAGWLQTGADASARRTDDGRAEAVPLDRAGSAPVQEDLSDDREGQRLDGGTTRTSWRGVLPRLSTWYYAAGGAVVVAAVLLIAILVYRHNQPQVSVVARIRCTVTQAPAQGLDLRGTGCDLRERSDHTTVVAFTGLPVLPRSKAYELWLIPSKGAPLPVGGFVGGSGAGFTGHYTIDARPYALAAVTVEPAPGTSLAPSSAPIITFALKA